MPLILSFSWSRAAVPSLRFSLDSNKWLSKQQNLAISQLMERRDSTMSCVSKGPFLFAVISDVYFCSLSLPAVLDSKAIDSNQPMNALMRLNQIRPGLQYKLLSQSGPVHAPVFTMSVDVDGTVYEASGSSKKTAKLHVAVKVHLVIRAVNVTEGLLHSKICILSSFTCPCASLKPVQEERKQCPSCSPPCSEST